MKFEATKENEAMSLFRLDASIRTEGSHSAELGDIVEREWRRDHPAAEVVRRHVGLDPVPMTAWPAAVAGGPIPEDARTAEQTAAIALATQYADELVDADALLFAVPLYNYGVSQHFKTWFDLVYTDPRVGPGGTALRGKPAVLATVQGGNYADGAPREGWDHATPWMERMLRDVWGLDLRTTVRRFTLVGVNPALDDFTQVAAELAEAARDEAAGHGRYLAERHPGAAAA
jgi:FMN-dependent NADH-azoreductase